MIRQHGFGSRGHFTVDSQIGAPVFGLTVFVQATDSYSCTVRSCMHEDFNPNRRRFNKPISKDDVHLTCKMISKVLLVRVCMRLVRTG